MSAEPPAERTSRSNVGYMYDTVLVLDATELHRDWFLHAPDFRLLGYYARERGLTVYVPAPVIAETVANYERECAELAARVKVLERDARRLRAGSVGTVLPVPYRAALHQALDALGLEVLPWPTVDHQAIVERAATRVAPFDSAGSGYRDTLTWLSTLEAASRGGHVVLISNDRDFRGSSGGLAPALESEAAARGASIGLFPSIAAWIGHADPRRSSIRAAAASVRDEQLIGYLHEADYLSEMQLGPEDVGFPPGTSPDNEISDVYMSSWRRASEAVERDGRFCVEYDLYGVGTVDARVTPGDADRNGWRYYDGPDWEGMVLVDQEVTFTVRLEVEFSEHDEIEDISVIDISSGARFEDTLDYPTRPIDGQMELELDGRPLVAD